MKWIGLAIITLFIFISCLNFYKRRRPKTTNSITPNSAVNKIKYIDSDDSDDDWYLFV